MPWESSSRRRRPPSTASSTPSANGCSRTETTATTRSSVRRDPAGLALGRKTYEGLAGYWPSQTGKWADMVNAMPKYVGSTTFSGDLEWNATLLEGDLEDSIPKLKERSTATCSCTAAATSPTPC